MTAKTRTRPAATLHLTLSAKPCTTHHHTTPNAIALCCAVLRCAGPCCAALRCAVLGCLVHSFAPWVSYSMYPYVPICISLYLYIYIYRYAVLGVAKDATGGEIRKAYRKLSMIWHPDKNQGGGDKKEEATAKFASISVAYVARATHLLSPLPPPPARPPLLHHSLLSVYSL
jgi:hypothetical protein